MLRRLLVTGVVFLTALVLLFVQNKVLVGDQDLTADLRAVDGAERTFQVVLKDVAGNPVEAYAEDRDAVAARLKGGGSLAEIPVSEVKYIDADRRVVIVLPEGGTDAPVRSRLAGKTFKHPNPPRDLFHITRGIDVRGGVEFVCRLKNDDGRVVAADDEVLAILRNRLDERGLTEPTVTRLSNGDVQVVIPGGTKADAARTRKVLETTGRLEFREVLDTYYGQRVGDPDAKVAPKPGGGWGFASGTYHNRGDVVMPHEAEPGQTPTTFFRLDKPALVGKDVADAHETMFEGQLAIGIAFTATGAAKNEEFTRGVKMRGDAKTGTGQLAICFDNVVKSNANVIEPSGANCVIHGRFTHDEIENIRSALKGGSLAVTPEVLSERVVGATLGEETIRKGVVAMLVSFVAIVLFMQVYYGRYLGSVANIALVAMAFMTWAVTSIFGATITLPGLAGLVLTIGMAVDTNILIFERIREELREKKGMRAAIEAGYERAFLTILDAHLTTFITAFILYFIGSGPVKGFGLMLMVGIVVNMFSGVFIGRLLTDWLCRKIDDVKMASWIPELRLPYVAWRKIGYAISIITAAGGLAWFAFGHHVTGGGFDRNFAIDFTGGNMAQVIFKEPQDEASVRTILHEAHNRDAKAFNLLDPEELSKQPYFADFGVGGGKSRQWVFRARDDEGSRLEKEREGLEKERAGLNRQADALRQRDIPDEAGARAIEERIKPLSARISELTVAIANRTEAFKHQLGNAFAERVAAEGDEILAASWQDRVLTIRLATLDPVSSTAASEIAVRLQRRTDSEDAACTAFDGGIEARVTFRSRPLSRNDIDGTDAAATRLATLIGGDDAKARNGLVNASLIAYNELVNVSASQKVTVARPYPSTEHFSGQVAGQMKLAALIATALSLLAILAYVAARFEFRFGIGAVLALFHDVAVTVGIACLLGIRIDLTVVAAILTIIGYSINDTIVTFDRIRENIRHNIAQVAKGAVTKTLGQIIDDSIAQTMPRTALTTGTVVTTVVVLLLFGGDAMYAFSMTMLIGLISGTYSSVFVAAPLLLSFKGAAVDRDPDAATPAIDGDGDGGPSPAGSPATA